MLCSIGGLVSGGGGVAGRHIWRAEMKGRRGRGLRGMGGGARRLVCLLGTGSGA